MTLSQMQRMTLSALVACVWSVSCGRPGGPPPPLEVSLDNVEILAAVEDFGGRSSLFTGEGWATPESSAGSDDWRSMAWALGRTAVLRVPTVPEEKVDFFARMLPFPWT